MERGPKNSNTITLKIRVQRIRFGVIIFEIMIILAFIIGVMTQLWTPNGSTILFLLFCMMIPLVFLSNPENPHDDD
jgi:uncharacterized membrane protein